MNRHFVAAAVAAGMSIAVSVPAVAGDIEQLARFAGLESVELDTLTLDEIAAVKFNQDGRGTEQTLVRRASIDGVPGTGAVRSSRTPQDLDGFHVDLINASVSGDERQPKVLRDTRYNDPRTRAQLGASAGIAYADAEAMTLDAVARQKFNGDSYGSN